MKAAVLVLSGAQDDLTPAAACEEHAAALEAAGIQAEVHVYPKSAHAFDLINGSRSMPHVQSAANCPFAIDETGMLILADGSRVTDAAGLRDMRGSVSGSASPMPEPSRRTPPSWLS